MFARPTTLDLALSQMNPVHRLTPHFSGYTSPFGLWSLTTRVQFVEFTVERSPHGIYSDNRTRFGISHVR